MSNNTRRLTLGAMMTALTTVFLWFACIMPTGQVGFAAITSLFGMIAIAVHGVPSGVLIYAASSILGFFILPGKGIVYLYLIFFGIYPVIKYLAEKHLGKILSRAAKLAYFLAALSVTWFVIGRLVFSEATMSKNVFLVFIGGTAVFILFDIGITRLLIYCTGKISEIKR